MISNASSLFTFAIKAAFFIIESSNSLKKLNHSFLSLSNSSFSKFGFKNSKCLIAIFLDFIIGRIAITSRALLVYIKRFSKFSFSFEESSLFK